MTSEYDVIIIGAGIAGLTCATTLRLHGYTVGIFERDAQPGGHVARWHKCFPFEMTGEEIIKRTAEGTIALSEIKTGTEITDMRKKDDNTFSISTNQGQYSAKTVVVATGYKLFDASIKEELGYGIYPRVITSAELEDAWREGRQPFDVSDSDAPRFAIVHCVGSRDLKCNITHCSKVCCMAGIKAARELKTHYPTCQVTNYYMDLRMFDNQYEELYHEAQTQYNVQFLRGRISEISLGNRKRLKLKSEDTLLGIPVADRVHGVVLMVGMHPNRPLVVDDEPMPTTGNGFAQSASALDSNTTLHKGIFLAGACKGPKTITETIADSKAAAMAVDEYLKHLS